VPAAAHFASVAPPPNSTSSGWAPMARATAGVGRFRTRHRLGEVGGRVELEREARSAATSTSHPSGRSGTRRSRRPRRAASAGAREAAGAVREGEPGAGRHAGDVRAVAMSVGTRVTPSVSASRRGPWRAAGRRGPRPPGRCRAAQGEPPGLHGAVQPEAGSRSPRRPAPPPTSAHPRRRTRPRCAAGRRLEHGGGHGGGQRDPGRWVEHVRQALLGGGEGLHRHEHGRSRRHHHLNLTGGGDLTSRSMTMNVAVIGGARGGPPSLISVPRTLHHAVGAPARRGRGGARRAPQLDVPGRLRPDPSLHATTSLEEAVAAADVLVMGVPSHGMRETARELAGFLRPWVPVVSLSKGLEQGTGCA